MNPENKIFFGEHGITATSANHLANLAKEDAVQDLEELNAANFITTLVKQVGTNGAPDVVDEGKDEAFIEEVRHKAQVVGFTRLYRRTMRRDKDNIALIDHCKKRLIEEIDKVNNVTCE